MGPPDIAPLAALLAAGLAGAFLLTAWTLARRLSHPPRRGYAWALARKAPADPSELTPPRGFTEWTLEWRGWELPVWEMAGDDASGPTLVLTPGWGESRVVGLARAAALAPACARVVLWDPPGLGSSRPRGKATARGPFLMGTAEHRALRALLRRLDEGPDTGVILFGWSAGAGTSIVAAAMADGGDDADATPGARIIGVIAEAPYRLPWTPARNVTRSIGMPWAVVGPFVFACLGVRLRVGPWWRGFDRASHAARLRVPMLVLHGDADTVCPIADGEAIARASGSRGTFVRIAGGGHLDLWTDPGHRGACAAASARFMRETIAASA